MLEVVQRYNLYCGGGTLPPLWGLGFWHRVPADFNEEQCRKEVADFEKYDIPLDVLGLEPGWMTKSYPCTFEWQTKRFPDPKKFTQDMLGKGVRLNLWENPTCQNMQNFTKICIHTLAHTWCGSGLSLITMYKLLEI